MTDIGKEYGAALFMLAVESGEKKEYAGSLKGIRDAFSEEPDFMGLLSSPAVPMSERLSSIEAAFAGRVPENVLSFLMLMCEKGRIEHFNDAVEEYCELLDASEHVSVAKVTSAAELTEKEKERLKNKLESMYKGEVRIQYFTDETLLGGIVVETDGKIMDGSLRHRLRDVKEVMNI